MGASRHGHLAAAAPWVEAFLRGYTDGGGDAGAVRSAPAYVARTFAEVLFYRLVVRPVQRLVVRAGLARRLGSARSRTLRGGGYR